MEEENPFISLLLARVGVECCTWSIPFEISLCADAKARATLNLWEERRKGSTRTKKNFLSIFDHF
jgi:hypothetical protein